MITELIRKLFIKQKKEIDSTSIKYLQENRTKIVERHEFAMLGRVVEFIRQSDNQEDNGIVISDFFEGTERKYKIKTENGIIETPDFSVYSISSISDNVPNVADLMGRLEQYCNTCCLLLCEKECPLYKYQLKHDLRME